jgi:aquaporin Z
MSARLRPSRDRPLHGDPYPPARLHPDLYLAEFIGTAALILVGGSARRVPNDTVT